MNKGKQSEIFIGLTAAEIAVLSAAKNYKPYQPALNHAAALLCIDKAIEKLQEVKGKIEERLLAEKSRLSQKPQ